MCPQSEGKKKSQTAIKKSTPSGRSDMTLISCVIYVSTLSLVQLFWRVSSWLTPLGKSESGPEMLRSPDGFHKWDGLPSLIHKIICCSHCQWQCPCTKSFTLHARFFKSNKSSNIKLWLISHGLSLNFMISQNGAKAWNSMREKFNAASLF